jgi:hypothetical protein
MNQGTPNSIEARGLTARAREVGNNNNAPGFQRGGEHRVAANHIVHAPVGEARNYLTEAKELHSAAKRN